MKLTTAIRDAFVRQAMDDVPNIDYAEKIRTEALKIAVAELPPKVRAIWNDKATRDYVGNRYIHGGGIGAALPCADDEKLRELLDERLQHLKSARDEQDLTRKSLREKLRAVAYSVTTRKALADALPEFAKYLPEDDAAALRTVPAIANVVSEFAKAGWPKGAKKTKVVTERA